VSPRKAKALAAVAEAATPREAEAPVPVPVGTTEPWVPTRLVVFGVEGQRYALPIESVQEIQQIVALSEIPDDSGAVVGVINLRGAVVPAMDIRRLLGLPERAYDLQTPMVFTRTPRGIVALIVDEVEDVVEVAAGSMHEASASFDLADKLLGVCRLEDRLVFVFDVARLVPAPRSGRR
jgi:purine-binding chemotaxis protein CheW